MENSWGGKYNLTCKEVKCKYCGSIIVRCVKLLSYCCFKCRSKRQRKVALERSQKEVEVRKALKLATLNRKINMNNFKDNLICYLFGHALPNEIPEHYHETPEESKKYLIVQCERCKTNQQLISFDTYKNIFK